MLQPEANDERRRGAGRARRNSALLSPGVCSPWDCSGVHPLQSRAPMRAQRPRRRTPVRSSTALRRPWRSGSPAGHRALPAGSRPRRSSVGPSGASERPASGSTSPDGRPRPSSGWTTCWNAGRSPSLRGIRRTGIVPQLLAEIDDAARSGRLAEAEERLDRFDALFPGDPAVAAFEERLEAARRDAAEGHLAQIDAARRVKDPDRVLELFRAAGPSLEADRRSELERDLAKWFLELLHRRLRVVPIQADVVQLAAQVAETFGTTLEGASLRASLPTLRRSVGLCPRCAPALPWHGRRLPAVPGRRGGWTCRRGRAGRPDRARMMRPGTAHPSRILIRNTGWG